MPVRTAWFVPLQPLFNNTSCGPIGTGEAGMRIRRKSYHFSGASGSRSMTYFPRATLIIGAPGILLLKGQSLVPCRLQQTTYRIRRFKSRSLVATIYTRCLMTRSTRQSSAYVPLWSHRILSNRGSLATRNASRYFWPNFSSSASTQSVTTGMHLAYRQSIIVGMTSSLC